MFVVNGGEHCRKTHVVYRLQSPSHVLISTIRSVHCLARTATALRCQRGILIDRYLQLTQVGKYCLLPSHPYIIRVVTTSTITTRMHHISTQYSIRRSETSAICPANAHQSLYTISIPNSNLSQTARMSLLEPLGLLRGRQRQGMHIRCRLILLLEHLRLGIGASGSLVIGRLFACSAVEITMSDGDTR